LLLLEELNNKIVFKKGWRGKMKKNMFFFFFVPGFGCAELCSKVKGSQDESLTRE
jgi:hypothetical protein